MVLNIETILMCISLQVVFSLPLKTVEDPLPIYFINLEHQTERKTTVINFLREAGYTSVTPVKAFTKKDFDFEILDVEECRTKRTTIDNLLTGTLERVPHKELVSRRVIIENLCFRKKGRNALVELAVLFSHLYTIYLATHNSASTSKYAVILEDDFVLPFHFNLTSLIDVAPKGFATLQFISSALHVTKTGVATYQSSGTLFTPRPQHAWCLGAYLIDLDRFRPFIETVFKFTPGEVKPIVNLYLVQNCDFTSLYQPPTVCSPYRFAADYTVYHVFNNDTYTSTLPMAESINAKLKTGGSSGIAIFNKKAGDAANLRSLAASNDLLHKVRTGEIAAPPYIAVL